MRQHSLSLSLNLRKIADHAASAFVKIAYKEVKSNDNIKLSKDKEIKELSIELAARQYKNEITEEQAKQIIKEYAKDRIDLEGSPLKKSYFTQIVALKCSIVSAQLAKRDQKKIAGLKALLTAAKYNYNETKEKKINDLVEDLEGKLSADLDIVQDLEDKLSAD